MIISSSLCSAADVGPIDIGAHGFASHSTSGFALDGNSQSLTAKLSVCDVSQMTECRSDAGCKPLALINRHREPKSVEVHLDHYKHHTVLVNTPFGEFTIR